MRTAENRRILEFHRLGKQVQRDDQKAAIRMDGKHVGVSKRFCKRLGVGRDQIEKARKFVKLYTDEEVRVFCKLGENGKQLSKSHLIRLLAVPSRRSRHKLARLAAEQGWSVQRLGQEIKRLGKNHPKGRRPKRPATVDEALGQIQRMVQQWERWCKMMKDKNDKRGVSIGDLPVQVARAVAGMSKSLQAAAMATRISRNV